MVEPFAVANYKGRSVYVYSLSVKSEKSSSILICICIVCLCILVVVLRSFTGLAGFSLFSAPNTSIIMGSVSPRETGDASAMVAVMRQTGMMLSMGIAMLFISVVMGSADNLNPDTYDSFIEVMRYSFGLCVVMCLIGAVVSMFRGKGSVEDC